MESAVRNLSGYEEYIDIPSLIDWFLLNEFSYNTDGTFRRSNYFLKKKSGKLYVATACLWQFYHGFRQLFRMDLPWKFQNRRL